MARGWTLARRVGIGVLGVLLLLAFTPILRPLIRAWVRMDAPRHADAIMVLGGYASADRVLMGLGLWKRGLAPRLLLPPAGAVGPDTTATDLQFLLNLAGAESAVVFVDRAFSTRQEALALRRVRERYRLRSVLVVTSPIHTHRACATMEKATGLTVVCVPALERMPETVTPRSPVNRLIAAYQYLYEVSATVEYRFRGWM